MCLCGGRGAGDSRHVGLPSNSGCFLLNSGAKNERLDAIERERERERETLTETEREKERERERERERDRH